MMELMVIERDSRRHVVGAIKLEKELQSSEILNFNLYEDQLKEFVAKLNEINSIAN